MYYPKRNYIGGYGYTKLQVGPHIHSVRNLDPDQKQRIAIRDHGVCQVLIQK